MRPLLLALSLLCVTPALAEDLVPRDGWVVVNTAKSHADLTADLKQAAKAQNMGIVTQASPTATARKRGIDIPENRVIGVFNNDFAVKVLATSTAAMIEAPIRFYITENTNGTATLSYKKPSEVFAPYYSEGGDTLVKLADSLDLVFDRITVTATR